MYYKLKEKILPTIYYCIYCGNKIPEYTALYGTGRCRNCYNIWRKIPENNPNFKDGKSKYRKNGFDCINNCDNQTCQEGNECRSCSSNRRGKNPKNNPMFGKKHKYSTKKKMRLKALIRLSNPKANPRYIDGRSRLPYPIQFNRILKNNIHKRDNFLCQRCSTTEKKHLIIYNEILHVHHIDYNKDNLKLCNLITLCRSCNSIANANRDYWFAYYTYIVENGGL